MKQNSMMLYDHRKHTLGYYFIKKLILMNPEKGVYLTSVELGGEAL